MSRFTNYGENKIADIFRGVPWVLGGSIYLGLASAASDSSFTPLAGTGYARQPVARDLDSWAATQGAGITVPSTGNSHVSSNNNLVDFGTAGSSWGTCAFVTMHDALTGGNCFAYIPVAAFAINSSDAVSFAAATIIFTLGLYGGTSDYLANKLIDLIWRNQSYTYPANTYIAFCTAAPTNSSGGTEVSLAGGYARQALPSTTTAISATDNPGTTSASGGTSGQISNNSAITFGSPTSNWGTITHDKQMDAPTGGNMLFYGTLDSPRSVTTGSTPPSYGAGQYKITIA